ncbi:scavenger receptor class F member 1 [Dromaius novaehollandiae]|uniref:scavenger receptor class F member 1 n=1 Tax=Dromaius novaehollandiae TaxID=8790 RepID=UPI00311F23F9
MAPARPILCLQLWLWLQGSAQELDPDGRNVCRAGSLPAGLACCPGWKQQGRECTEALCEGEDACGADEVCVRPGVCLCKPGFFGADCSSRCPEQYWGPDCKRRCPCHPDGTCEAASGRCSCLPGRWGPRCQFACACGPRGRCEPLSGACRCEPGWWGPSCARQCQCNPEGSRCDPLGGRCRCLPGWWGRRCSFRCSCNGSPCSQETGKCECAAGFWGPACQRPCDCLHGACNPLSGHCSCGAGYHGRSCREPCPAGRYGPHCVHSCGSCRGGQPCAAADGACAGCRPGWNGTLCKERCAAGYHGAGCHHRCPRCRAGEACDPESGACAGCEPGWTGPSCNSSCPAGTFGDGCQQPCPDCVSGSCDPVSGACVCWAGYWGGSCNETCPEGYFGVNCSSACQCSRGTCHPARGDCVWRAKDHGALAAAVLVPLLLLLLCGACCCCGAGQADARDRAAAADDDVVSRMKHHVRRVLANLSAMMPCFSLGGSKLPKVTVSHHDAEIPFNPSFIEPPSTAWVSDSSFSSFDTDNEGPEYSVPPREGVPVLAGAELQDGASPAGEALPDPSAFSSEDVSQPFAIPRTSSLAKAKRPSVSFAEGTKFGPQGRGALAAEPLPDRPPGSDSPEPPAAAEESHRAAGRATGAGGRRRGASGTRQVAQRVEALEAAAKAGGREARGKEPSVTTIYVMVGTAGQEAEAGGEGPVQAVLKRLGSAQWARRAAKEEPPVRRSAEGIQEPPRRALAQRRDSAPGSKQRESGASPVPGAATEPPAGKHLPGTRRPKSAGAWEGAAAEPEEEEPKYENVRTSPGPEQPPAAPGSAAGT